MLTCHSAFSICGGGGSGDGHRGGGGGGGGCCGGNFNVMRGINSD